LEVEVEVEAEVEADVDEDDELFAVVPHTISEATPATPMLSIVTVVVRLAARFFPVVLMSIFIASLISSNCVTIYVPPDFFEAV
jgi:hypothetical protein